MLKINFAVFIIISLFLFSSCNNEDSVHNNYQNEPQITNNENLIAHPWELIITVVDNNGNDASEYFCFYRADNNALHGCGSNPLGGWWSANVDELQWPQQSGEIIPNLLYGVQYRVEAPNTEGANVMYIRFNYAGNPDTYIRYNKDRGQFTIESLGQGVDIQILR